MELTQAEKDIILARRAQEAEETTRAHYRLLIHAAAHRFIVWKVENGAGSSYSTFCDDFGYDNPGVDRPQLYRDVLAVIKFVRERATPPRTHAEAQAQAIVDFVARALENAAGSGGTVAYAVQVELDILVKETGVLQSFERILPGLADEGMGYCGADWEVVEL